MTLDYWMYASMAQSPARYMAGFAVTGIFAWLLLMFFPFYPAQLTIILALALGGIGLKSPRIGLMLALLLTMIAALFQGEFLGLTFFIVLVMASGLDSWGLVLMITSWMLVFQTSFPSLAILPIVASGLYERRSEALRLGIVSAVTIFLLSWMRNVGRAGIILVSSTSSYVPKNIPSPWYFTLFTPSLDTFTMDGLSNYYAPLIANLNDYRVYVAMIAFSVAGYLTALLIASGKRNHKYFLSGVTGALPAVIVGLVVVKVPLLQLVAVLFVAAMLPVILLPIRSKIVRPKEKAATSDHVTTKILDHRQPAVIMFTDVVGYTVLLKEDESKAVKLLNEHDELARPIVERHKGREVMAKADTRIIEFTNALDALNCAVELQMAVQKLSSNGKEMKLRIGLHLGEVIHHDGAVLGEAVNVAARIEILAEPGGICISREVYDQVLNETSYEMTALAPNELKNVQYPVEIYRVSLPKTDEETTGKGIQP